MMSILSSQIQSIEKIFILYGECYRPFLFRGEVYNIFCNRILLAECIAWEAIVNSFEPIRQITLQYEQNNWELEKKIIHLSKMYSPFILELQSKDMDGIFEFNVKNNNNYVQYTQPGYQIVIYDCAKMWGENGNISISINTEDIGFFKVNRSPFGKDKKLLIELSDEIANRIMLALLNNESCLINSH